MRGYFPESVSDYTREQCEEYLAAHPNGLRADSVRERLKVLSPPDPPKPDPPKTEKNRKDDSTNLLKSKEGSSRSASSATSSFSSSPSSLDFADVLRVIGWILVVGLAILTVMVFVNDLPKTLLVPIAAVGTWLFNKLEH